MASPPSHPAEVVTLESKGPKTQDSERWHSSAVRQAWEAGTGMARLQILVPHEKMQQKNGWSPSLPNKAYKNNPFPNKKLLKQFLRSSGSSNTRKLPLNLPGFCSIQAFFNFSDK